MHIQTDAEPRRGMSSQTDRVFKMSTNRYKDKVLEKTTDSQVVRELVISISQTSMLLQIPSHALKHIQGLSRVLVIHHMQHLVLLLRLPKPQTDQPS